MSDHIYFAIGDVHGESDRLGQMHAAILARVARESQRARIVHLGDYVDRGPDSRGVIERIMALERLVAGSDRIEVISLLGNHEQLFLSAWETPGDPESWWVQGGAETADSYADDPPADPVRWRSTIPRDHIEWLRRLPSLYFDRDRRLAFVHAGIDPARFPDCPEMIRIWTRAERFTNSAAWPDREALRDVVVIHGHTPKAITPEVEGRRINVDTGAVYGGPLTAVMLKPGAAPEFLRVDQRHP